MRLLIYSISSLCVTSVLSAVSSVLLVYPSVCCGSCDASVLCKLLRYLDSCGHLVSSVDISSMFRLSMILGNADLHAVHGAVARLLVVEISPRPAFLIGKNISFGACEQSLLIISDHMSVTSSSNYCASSFVTKLMRSACCVAAPMYVDNRSPAVMLLSPACRNSRIALTSSRNLVFALVSILSWLPSSMLPSSTSPGILRWPPRQFMVDFVIGAYCSSISYWQLALHICILVF